MEYFAAIISHSQLMARTLYEEGLARLMKLFAQLEDNFYRDIFWKMNECSSSCHLKKKLVCSLIISREVSVYQWQLGKPSEVKYLLQSGLTSPLFSRKKNKITYFF